MHLVRETQGSIPGATFCYRLAQILKELFDKSCEMIAWMLRGMFGYLECHPKSARPPITFRGATEILWIFRIVAKINLLHEDPKQFGYIGR